MDAAEIYSRLTPIFQDIFDDDSIVPTAEMTAKDVDEWDSLSHIRMILAVEKEFSLKFSTTEVGHLEKVGDLVSLIQSRA
ncbi:acyl carrier protein [Silvibacterium dinghuense]|uniref:Acyl carrier protein n=1 Tax=Silvibacterium dinghuense TaxID=1560006 RepID=A0A4Q1SHY1_9BACT|nr:acyl carrier protein [Silvibacterium dinghuense]RXS96790.1 acyl carrier protein [Silvibacterium dinghuense]GGG93658.1 acyl carrier protein [Silvibacterium dinghuense]